MTVATITREKQSQRGAKFEWSWLYSVNGIARTTSLAEAESYCKRKGWTPVRAWEIEVRTEQQK